MPAVTLSQVARGIDRTRVRGNVQPDGLYELTNAYVTPARVIRKRPGFKRIGSAPAEFSMGGGVPLWEGKGLGSLGGELVFFSDRYRGASGVAGSADLRVLRYLPRAGEPASYADSATLLQVRQVGVFLGRLYVAAEWVLPTTERVIRHYWISDPPAWGQNAPYDLNDVVRASPDNGFVYRLTGVPSYPAWRPSTEYTVGDSVQPTTYNGFRYELIQNVGTPLVSGDTEPAWPRSTKPGSNRVTESRSPTATIATRPPADPPTPPAPPPPGPSGPIQREYGIGWRDQFRGPIRTFEQER